jgi:hypothetical protein
VIVRGVAVVAVAAATAIVSDTDCDWTGELLSLTVTVKLEDPFDVGFPEMVPVDESESPAGS